MSAVAGTTANEQGPRMHDQKQPTRVSAALCSHLPYVTLFALTALATLVAKAAAATPPDGRGAPTA